MKFEEIKEKAEKLRWFQCVPMVSEDEGVYVSKGVVDHCTEDIATHRYGMPLDLSGKTVLDIGAMNGYHSLLAEKRGAKVTAIEPVQGYGDNFECLKLALEANNSTVDARLLSLEHFYEEYFVKAAYDICFYYGVLYHVLNPIQELGYLSDLTKEYALIETAISQNYADGSIWELRHGFDNDPTNYFYPTLDGLWNALKLVGFKSMEVIYNDGIRATVKAIK